VNTACLMMAISKNLPNNKSLPKLNKKENKVKKKTTNLLKLLTGFMSCMPFAVHFITLENSFDGGIIVCS
jgi:hypothetical protein